MMSSSLLMLIGTIGLLSWDYEKWIMLFQVDHQIKLDLMMQAKDIVLTDSISIISGSIFVLLGLGGQLIVSSNHESLLACDNGFNYCCNIC